MDRGFNCWSNPSSTKQSQAFTSKTLLSLGVEFHENRGAWSRQDGVGALREPAADQRGGIRLQSGRRASRGRTDEPVGRKRQRRAAGARQRRQRRHRRRLCAETGDDADDARSGSCQVWFSFFLDWAKMALLVSTWSFYWLLLFEPGVEVFLATSKRIYYCSLLSKRVFFRHWLVMSTWIYNSCWNEASSLTKLFDHFLHLAA